MADHVQTIAVDFDGVLHSYDKGWQDGSIYGEWKPGAVTALSQLMHDYAVFVHTTRNPRQVARWIERMSGRGFECTTRIPRLGLLRRPGFWQEKGYLLVTSRKLPAVAYIDDRAVRFESWPQTLGYLGIEALEKPAGP
ncbi:hypothetical protein [Streptomyces spiralis]